METKNAYYIGDESYLFVGAGVETHAGMPYAH